MKPKDISQVEIATRCEKRHSQIENFEDDCNDKSLKSLLFYRLTKADRLKVHAPIFTVFVDPTVP